MAERQRSRSASFTDNEGSILGLVARREPVSTYQLMRIFAESPVTSLNESKGTIYPVVRRLKAKKFLSAHTIEGDARNTELLRCTAKGKAALRQWLMTIPERAILLEDPLRTKLLSFEFLSRDEQRQWIQNARAAVAEKIEEVESFGVSLRIPYRDLIFENLAMALEARRQWIERVSETLGLND